MQPRKIISSLNLAEQTEINEPASRHNFKDRHSHREAMLVLENTVTQSLNGRIYEGGPGSLFLFDSNEGHDQGYSSSTPDGAHFWLFLFPNVINCIGDETRGGSQIIDFRAIYRNQELLTLLHATWDDAAAGRLPPEIALPRLHAIFNLIFTEVVKSLTSGSGEPETHSHQHEAISEVRKYLDRTCGRDTDILSLARIAGYSRPHFLRLFRQYAGCRVQEYIDSRRIQRYEQLIAQGRAKKEIADELGFSSAAALAHWRKDKMPDQ